MVMRKVMAGVVVPVILVALDAAASVYVYFKLGPRMKSKDKVDLTPKIESPPQERRRGYSDHLHQDYIQEAKNGEEANPFVNLTVEIDEYERVKLSVMSVTIFPVRILLTIVILLLAALYTNVAGIGMAKEDGITKPISRVRSLLTFPFRMMLRLLLFVWGFHWVKIKGRKATAKEAPVICPNHVSFIEPLWIVYANMPMSVGAYATMMFPGFSKAHKLLQNIPLMKYLEPNTVDNVYSREWVKAQITGRTKSGGIWPQVSWSEATATATVTAAYQHTD